ncbi:Autophagy-related protein 16 [Penicillium citrinum]|uniref:Autophagy-related protein 16 n=2 Tax=Penicillium TaxID=5073 RepID=A0A9W9TMY7_PENCI|nr:Autophagy-related protein 16 [Penicillium citrinum]KAJ5227030.1 Autophagy-related protein 16 [Penicillium citrinum]KAJ5568509.1 Autophagy-related protein 16 [Penicillium hetheringtonii]
MAHWREEYLTALAVRDQREKANLSIYDAYTRLADSTAKLPATIDTSGSPSGDKGPSGTYESEKTAFSQSRTAKKQQTEVEPSVTELLNTTRAELAEAQRSRAELRDRLERATNEAEKLRKQIGKDGRRIHGLENEVAQQQKRRKDVEEELRGKAKLLNEFQDEIAALTLQVNMAERKAKKLGEENDDLVNRWMKRMGQEADAMNDASKFS